MSLSRLNAVSGLSLQRSFICFVRCITTSSETKSALPIPNWNNAISNAEKIVDYQTTSLGLRWLMNDDVANFGEHLQKIEESSHPIVKFTKDMLNNRHSSLQAWGLIVMLMSRAICQENSEKTQYSQQVLAEAIEKIHCSRLMHQSIFNLQTQSQNTNDLINDGDNKFGNMVALLSGDYLVTNAINKISNLRNQKLVQLMASVSRDLVEADFIGDRDNQNNALPSDPRIIPHIALDEYIPPSPPRYYEDDVPNVHLIPMENFAGDPEKEWTYRHVLIAGTLLGKGCQGAVMLAGQNRMQQNQGFLFGKHLALAWQAYIDMKPFKLQTLPAGSQFSLISAPLLFHLAHDPQMYDLIRKGSVSVDNIDYAEVHRQVRRGPGIAKTKNLQIKHSVEAMTIINELPSSDAQVALQNIILAMQDLS